MARRMTPVEEKEIKDLRRQNLSYAEIAKLTGFGKEVIRYHTDEKTQSNAKHYASKYFSQEKIRSKENARQKAIRHLDSHVVNLLASCRSDMNIPEMRKSLEERLGIKFSEYFENKIDVIVKDFIKLGKNSPVVCTENYRYRINRNSPYYKAYLEGKN